MTETTHVGGWCCAFLTSFTGDGSEQIQVLVKGRRLDLFAIDVLIAHMNLQREIHLRSAMAERIPEPAAKVKVDV